MPATFVKTLCVNCLWDESLRSVPLCNLFRGLVVETSHREESSHVRRPLSLDTKPLYNMSVCSLATSTNTEITQDFKLFEEHTESQYLAIDWNPKNVVLTRALSSRYSITIKITV